MIKTSKNPYLSVLLLKKVNGKVFFDNIRENPLEMPLNCLFAPLLRIPSEAFKQQVGKHLEHVWAYPIETFSNLEGWQTLNTNDRDL